MTSWTKDEDDCLKENYYNLGAKFCAERLNRPIKGVEYRAQKLGIKGQRTRKRQHKVLLTEVQKQYILSEHKQGKQTKQIYLASGIKPHLIKRTLRENGVGPKPNRSQLLTKEISEEYMRLDLTWDQMSEKYSMSKSQMMRIVKENGLHNPQRINAFRGDINKRRKGLTTYQLWVQRYGKEEADKKQAALKKQQSRQTKGRNNPMYGKVTPQGAGNGWKGWYKDQYFRSLREVTFMIELDSKGIEWESAEKIKIPYLMNGVERTYRPDYLVGNRVIEIKPIKLHKTPTIEAKARAAAIYCQERGLRYEIVDVEVNAESIFKALKGKLVRFDRDYESRFLAFMAK